MKLRGQLYGWYDQDKREFRLSQYPGDAPVRPSVALATKQEALEIARRKRKSIYWWPPLPSEIEAAP